MQKVNNFLRFNDRKELGRGARSTVYEGIYGSLPVAVKRILCSDKADTKQTREVDIMHKIETLRHINMVGFYYCVVSDAYLYLAMELCQGTLKDYINSDNLKDNFPPLKVNISMAKGLQYLHSRDVVHRDLKPENIFFVSKGHDNIQKIVLGDIATSKCTVKDMYSVTGNVGYIPHELCDMIEKIPRSKITTKSDIFALGCLFYYTYTGGEHPFGNMIDRQSNIGKASTPSLEHLDDHLQPCRVLLTNMLSHTPEQRPNATEVVTHPALWMPEKIISFFTYASNTAKNMYKNNPVSIGMLEVTHVIPNENWISRLPTHLQKCFLGRGNAGNDSRVVSLLRAIRNMAAHYEEYSEDVKMELGRFPGGHAQFWMKVCPKLLMHVHRFFTENIKDMPPEYQVASSESASSLLPVEILRMDQKSIDMYMQALTEGKEAVYSIRLMVVGHYDVGKTALTKRLLGEKVEITKRDSTNGIEVHVRRCKVFLQDGQWNVLKKDEKSENNFKRLAKLMVHGNDRNSDDENSVDSAALDNYGKKKRNEVEEERQRKKIEGRSDEDMVVKPIADQGSDIKEDKKADDTHVDEKPSFMKDLKEIILEANKSNLHEEKDCANLSIWDFAGQYAFYSTHQLFLSSRAVYLLVTDISKHINDVVIEDECYFDSRGPKACKISEFVEFWLNSIHGYCPSTQTGVPPVILIGTHADQLAEKDELSQAYFLALRNFLSDKVTQFHLADEEFAVDNSIVDPTLDALRSKILKVASQQDYWGELIPARWITLEMALMELKDKGLKITKKADIEQINLAMPVPLPTNEELQLFLRFQHDLGNILYFSDETLENSILLDPQWLADAFKCLITAKMFCSKKPHVYQKWQEFNNRAILQWDLIDAVWKKEENESFYIHRHHLIGLLERLDIIVKPRTFIDDKTNDKVQDYFFAPCVLKEPPPSDILTPCQSTDSMSTTKLCFTVPTRFIPTAIFNRLFAACLTRWPISRQSKKVLIYCGCGIFDVDVTHRLTLYFSDNVIQLWITKHGRKDYQPSSTVCANVREFVEQTLRRMKGHVCQLNELEIFVKCPNVGIEESGGLLKLNDLLDLEEIACHYHDKTHVLATSEMLRFWYKETASEIDHGVYSVLSFQTLERTPREGEFVTMSKRIGKEFQHLALEMGLTQAEIDQVRLDNPHTVADQIRHIMMRWKKAHARATFRELETLMRKVDIDTAEVFKDIR